MSNDISVAGTATTGFSAGSTIISADTMNIGPNPELVRETMQNANWAFQLFPEHVKSGFLIVHEGIPYIGGISIWFFISVVCLVGGLLFTGLQYELRRRELKHKLS